MRNWIVNTFSIVALDAATGELGSASASRSLGVGGAIAYSRLGVGVVNTQHYANLRLGETALKCINEGMHPQQALESALSEDPKRLARQLVAIDAKNRKGAWTGPQCTDVKHHVFGSDCVAAGNHLVSEQVIEAMVAAFEEHHEQSLSWRLLLALEAGEAAGGDKRGKQSAGIKVMPPNLTDAEEINVDLRVDDHPQPLAELRRLCELFWESYR
jgi:uncharacterized Ntn-hydrolase superfamily protein